MIRVKNTLHQVLKKLSARKFKEAFEKHTEKKSQTMKKHIITFLVGFIIIETIRLAIYQVFLCNYLDWDEIISVLGFAFLLFLLPARQFILIKGKKAPRYKTFGRFLKLLFIILYCGLITFRNLNFSKAFKQEEDTDDDNFYFLLAGILIVPNIIVTEIVFTKWYEKCSIPVWYLMNFCLLILKTNPENVDSLILKAVIYSIYVIAGCYIKEKLDLATFLQWAELKEWHQIHKEILQHVPENIAVFTLDGKLLYQNQYFSKLRTTIGDKEGETNILASITHIKMRGTVFTLKSHVRYL